MRFVVVLLGGLLGLSVGCDLLVGLDDPTTGKTGTSTSTGGAGGTGGEGGTTGQGAAPACVRAEVRACYDGPAGTEGVGVCKAGSQSCSEDGSGFGPCEGQVLPGVEDCAAKGDEDCDGVPCSEPVFVKQFGDSGGQATSAVATDPVTGDIVVAGSFASAMQLGSFLLNSKGSSDIFVAKLDAQGEVLWAKSFGGTKSEGALSVAVGSDGSVAVAGLGSGSSGGFQVGDTFVYDPIFVIKLSSNGNPKWTRECGGDPSGFGAGFTRVAVGGNGDVILAGTIQGTLDCGDGPKAGTVYDPFLVKLSGESGAPLWSKLFAGPGNSRGQSVALDQMGNIYFVGSFTDEIDFGLGSLVPAGIYAGFVVKLNANGAPLWNKSLDGSSPEAVAVDSLGGPLLVGTFQGTLKADASASSLVSNGGYDFFAVKLNTTGGHAWSKRLGDAYAGSNQTSLGAAFDGADFVVSGEFDGLLDFDGKELASEDEDSFVAKFDATTGAARWARQGAGTGNVELDAVAIAGGRRIVAAGWFSGSLDFGTGPLTSAGSSDVVVATFWP